MPDPVRLYLKHTDEGASLRALARAAGLNPSTVMRQIRRYEARRDDPLMDGALAALSRAGSGATSHPPFQMETAAMRHPHPAPPGPSRSGPRPEGLPPEGLPDEARIRREGFRILRRLVEPGAVLAFAPDMEKAVVLRELPDGSSTRTAVLERAMAQAFSLRDWIACRKPGRISTYAITPSGRAALRRMAGGRMAGERMAGEVPPGTPGLAESAAPFADQHRIWGERQTIADDGPRRTRVNLAESPITVLGRRRDKDGTPFLPPELVNAAERLREDFELAQMGPRVAQNWERFLTAGTRGGFAASGPADGSGRARDRVAAALADLGPGLGDVALRVCCFLEGVESAERRMGWAARSGKIVLRIALMRLRRHYDETYGRSGPLIG
ncbi:DUF6456 domain-containing protein [Pseudogemmobacter sonorensis]|uniref:DUF6456 domain-containing protein n=1 Tax=Pseudogemmobacter sonorensis TaxID=2989681 RepID=UPI00367C3D25